MAGKHRRDQHPRDLVITEPRSIGILRVHQGLKEVFAAIAGALPLLDDLGNHVA